MSCEVVLNIGRSMVLSERGQARSPFHWLRILRAPYSTAAITSTFHYLFSLKCLEEFSTGDRTHQQSFRKWMQSTGIITETGEHKGRGHFKGYLASMETSDCHFSFWQTEGRRTGLVSPRPDLFQSYHSGFSMPCSMVFPLCHTVGEYKGKSGLGG